MKTNASQGGIVRILKRVGDSRPNVKNQQVYVFKPTDELYIEGLHSPNADLHYLKSRNPQVYGELVRIRRKALACEKRCLRFPVRWSKRWDRHYRQALAWDNRFGGLLIDNKPEPVVDGISTRETGTVDENGMVTVDDKPAEHRLLTHQIHVHSGIRKWVRPEVPKGRSTHSILGLKLTDLHPEPKAEVLTTTWSVSPLVAIKRNQNLLELVE